MEEKTSLPADEAVSANLQLLGTLAERGKDANTDDLVKLGRCAAAVSRAIVSLLDKFSERDSHFYRLLDDRAFELASAKAEIARLEKLLAQEQDASEEARPKQGCLKAASNLFKNLLG